MGVFRQDNDSYIVVAMLVLAQAMAYTHSLQVRIRIQDVHMGYALLDISEFDRRYSSKHFVDSFFFTRGQTKIFLASL